MCTGSFLRILCDKTGVDEATMFRFTEGMGLGMEEWKGHAEPSVLLPFCRVKKQYGSAR